MNKQDRLALFEQVDIYPVTCETLSEGRTNLEFLDAVIAGGTKIVQLREKTLSKRDFFELASAFRARCKEAGILLIINDHLDVALGVNADGVHLGQDDYPLEAARRIAPELILGASTHNREEALRAAKEGADYFNIGPIYSTSTKEHLERFLGPEAIPDISKDIKIPFTVMGGIKMDNLAPLLEQGACRVAVVTALTQAKDIATATREMAEAIREGRKQGP
ncbi:MAG: thiamine phosphate synthase [Planctomycetota bacterium]|jgi:thiamine-phosphate pyrophosphorylase